MPSPIPFPHYPTRNIQLLDGVWDFTFLGPLKNPRTFDLAGLTYETRVSVPSVWDAMPAYAGQRGTGAFRTHVHARPGSRSLLRFGGLGQWAKVFVDGVSIGECAMPYTGFSLE